ncbi:DUF2442 domain-containing protein [Niabella ginsengisoli]|uniref:DUF2442 domain-containing protein n=1 Tax=Niabella ginsengisoli TaxID=522298 RepID=A0ABS9SLS8_9BACT|nr:DUF2442 domain-containing protein [Niabella ginsengisoli]MCH5599333.1 DUF2442 domain-containing protein [Niabella ginsengisoli]
MKTLTDISALSDFRLSCLFNDGSRRIADIKPFLNKEVFKPLADPDVFFSALHNGGYFIEWKGYDVDLSADTLWHISQPEAELFV